MQPSLLSIAGQLIAGLHHCHYGLSRTYIIHGDVKPSNGQLLSSMKSRSDHDI